MLAETRRTSRMHTVPVMPDGSDTATVDALSTADQSVVHDIEARYAQSMFGFVRRLGLTDHEAEDCVQEALARLATQLTRGTRIDDPKAWVFRTIYRLAMDEHRLRRRLHSIAVRLRPPVSVDPAAQDHVAAVWAEVDRLTPRQRQVLYLRYRSDLTFEQVATTLGITSGAARSHATTGLQILRRRLAVTSGDER